MRAPRARGTPRRAAAGFSMIEVVVALTVTVIGVLGLLATTTTGSRLQQQTQEYGRASRAAAGVHERLRSGDLDARVAELAAAPTFEDGPVAVEVSFPEDLLVDALGGAVPVGWRYRDLDADGQVDLDPAATAATSLVPVRVVARWEGGELRTSFLVTER